MNMKYYSINDIAMMTGFTTRTLRNYINLGILEGEKIDGVWRFSEENFNAFLSDVNVIASLKTKRNAHVFNFLLDDKKQENNICTILDFYVDDEEAATISTFFCEQMNDGNKSNTHFTFYRNGKNTRVILSGPEDIVTDIMRKYYTK